MMLLRATADRSASMWRRSVTRPPGAPVSLRFAWWIPEPLPGARVGDIDLDDAPVRVVLAFDGDHARLALRDQLLFDLVQTLTGERPPYASLVYVWDARTRPEEVVMNARTDRVRSIVVDSGPDGLRTWRLHRRDVVADYVRAFGEAPGPLMGLAVMTDTDNTLLRTDAWYGLVTLE